MIKIDIFYFNGTHITISWFPSIFYHFQNCNYEIIDMRKTKFLCTMTFRYSKKMAIYKVSDTLNRISIFFMIIPGIVSDTIKPKFMIRTAE